MNNFQRFIASGDPSDGADMVLIGVPFDGTACFRPGARFGPGGIRFWSDVLETYSRPFDADLEEVGLTDAGDLPVMSADWENTSNRIREAVSKALEEGSVPLLLGGEHLISLPAIQTCASHFPDIHIIHLDAHLDLRDHYEGLAFSHATVMRRVIESVRPDRLLQYGIRSGTREEWIFSKQHGTVVEDTRKLAELGGKGPVYLSIDLDVLDPSIMPETGAPEPGGMTFRELHELLLTIRGIKIVGADVVEYCPMPGWGGPSGAVAAKVVRELIFLCAEGRGK